MIESSIVEEDEDGELVITLSEALLSQMGWSEDTILEWELDGDVAILRERGTAGATSGNT